MSTRHFAQMQFDRQADEEYAEAVRIERLTAAGKLCGECFAIEGIEREATTFHCTNCGKRWPS
jgi:hypothetical protein